MIIVKIREGNYEGIINLEFVKTMYVNYDNLKDEFVVKAVFGNNDCIINRHKEKEKAFETIRLISRAVEDNVKVIYLNVQNYKYEEGESDENKKW